MKILSMYAAIAMAAMPTFVAAQQVTTSTPAGITVVASGTATVHDWDVEFGLRFVPTIATGKTAYAACTAAVEKLRSSLRAAGLEESIVKTAVEYASTVPGATTAGPTALAGIRTAPENVEKVVAAVSGDGWRGPVAPRQVPRDEQAATDSAYAAALTEARRQATAIAAADGRHIGRLLNVMPLPVDYFSSVLGSLATMATVLGRFTQTATLPEIKQSAIFTFELVP